jgi:hypothetical protein
MKRFRGIVILLIAMLAASPFFAYSQKLTATASATSIGLNNSVQVTFTLSGAQSEGFQAPAFTGFSASGPYQSSSSNISTINGKTVVESTVSWIYSVAPTKAGKFTITPAKAKVKGQWISSNSITIDVSNTGTPKQNQNQNQQTTKAEASANDLFIRAVADKTNVLQGEQVTVTYKIYTKIPLSQISIKKLPSFGGFWSTDLVKLDDKTKQYNEVINGQKYVVADLRKVALFPQKSGKLSIDPLEVECIAQIQVKTKANNPFGNFFNDPFFQNQFSIGYQEVKKEIKSNGMSISVAELPANNKPDDFIGFVGSLNMETKADKHEVKANEAINLTFTLTGKGNLSLLDKMNIEFPPDFEVYDPQVTENISSSGGEVSGSKSFNYLIIPRTQGNFKLKPVTLSYYDKNKKSYVTLSSGEIAIKVNKGDGSAASVTGGSNKEDIKYINSDIKFIDNKIFEVFPKGHFFFASLWYFILILLPVTLFIVFIVLMRRRIKLHSNVTLLKHKRATKIALKRLKQANTFMKAGDKNNFYVELSRALWGYISDKFSIPLANLSLDSAQYTLAEKHVSENIRNKFIEILNNCEFARFAPAEASVTMESIYNDAVAIISQTEQELK